MKDEAVKSRRSGPRMGYPTLIGLIIVCMALGVELFFIVRNMYAAHRRAQESRKAWHIVSKTKIESKVLLGPDAAQYVSLVKGRKEVKIPVILVKNIYRATNRPPDGSEYDAYPYQYEIKSIQKPDFSWSFWDFNEERYMDFKIYPLGRGRTALAFVHDPAPVFVMLVTEPIDGDKSLDRLLVEKEKWKYKSAAWVDGNSDEFPYDFENERPGVFLDKVYEKGSQLRVVVHGRDPNQVHTFAKKGDNWRLLSPAEVAATPHEPSALSAFVTSKDAWVMIVIVGLVITLIILRRRRHKAQ